MMEGGVTHCLVGSTIPLEQDSITPSSTTPVIMPTTREQDIHKAHAAASVDDTLQAQIRSLTSLGQHSKVLTAERKLVHFITKRTLTRCFQYMKAFCHYNHTTLIRSFAKLRKWCVANKFLRSDERSKAGSTEVTEQLEAHTASTRAKLVYKTPVKSVSVKKKPFRPSGTAIALVQGRNNVVFTTAHTHISNTGSTPTATRDSSRSYIQKKYYAAISPESVENVDSQHSNVRNDVHDHDAISVGSSNTRSFTYCKPIAEVRSLHCHPFYRHLQRLPSTHEDCNAVYSEMMQRVCPSVAVRSAAAPPGEGAHHSVEITTTAGSSPEFRAAKNTFAATVARTARWRDTTVNSLAGSLHSSSPKSTHAHGHAHAAARSEPSTPTAVPSPSTPLQSAHTSPFTPQRKTSPHLALSETKSVNGNMVSTFTSPSAAELAYARSRGSADLDLSVSLKGEESNPIVQPSLSPVHAEVPTGDFPAPGKADSPVFPHHQKLPANKLRSRLYLMQTGVSGISAASTSTGELMFSTDAPVQQNDQGVMATMEVVGRKASKLQALLSSQWKYSATATGISSSVDSDAWAAKRSSTDVCDWRDDCARTEPLPVRKREQLHSYFTDVNESETAAPPSKHYKYLKFRAFTHTIRNTQERRTAEMQVTMQCVEHYFMRCLFYGLVGLKQACVQARQRAQYRHDEFSTRNQALSKAFWRLRRHVTQCNAARYRQHRSARYRRLLLLSQGLSCLAAFALYRRQRYEIHIIPDASAHMCANTITVDVDDSTCSTGSDGSFSPLEGDHDHKLAVYAVKYESVRSETATEQDEAQISTDEEASLAATYLAQERTHSPRMAEHGSRTSIDESSPVPRRPLHLCGDSETGAVDEASPVPLPRAPLILSDIQVVKPALVLNHQNVEQASPALATPVRLSPSQSPSAHAEGDLPPLPDEDYPASPLHSTVATPTAPDSVGVNIALKSALSPSPEPERRPPQPHPHTPASPLRAPYSPPSPILAQHSGGSHSTLPPLPSWEDSFTLDQNETPVRHVHIHFTDGARAADTVCPLSPGSASDSPASLPFYTSPVADEDPPPLPTNDSMLSASDQQLSVELRGTPESSGDDMSLFLSDDSECSEGRSLEEYYTALYPVPLSPYPVPALKMASTSDVGTASRSVASLREEYASPPPLPPLSPGEIESHDFGAQSMHDDVPAPHSMNARSENVQGDSTASDPAMAEAQAYYRRTKLLLGLYAFNQWVLRSQAIAAMNDILAQFRRLHCIRKTVRLLKAQAIL